MYCNQCGSPMSETAQQCPRCGRVVPAVAVKRRLVRPVKNRRIAGVCAAYANYFEFDVTLVRVCWFLAFLFAGCGGLIYLISWVVIPEEEIAVPLVRVG